jgi:hypothetical protein
MTDFGADRAEKNHVCCGSTRRNEKYAQSFCNDDNGHFNLFHSVIRKSSHPSPFQVVPKKKVHGISNVSASWYLQHAPYIAVIP